MKAVYRNSIRSKELIRDAVIKLLVKHQDLNEVTVSDIVKQANINRGTFYNHYNNVADVIYEIKDELIVKLDNALKNLDANNIGNISVFFDIITEFLSENEEMYKNIIPYVSKEILYGMANRIIKQARSTLLQNPTISEMDLNILGNGIAGTYMQYFANNIPYSLQQLRDESVKTVYKFLSYTEK